MSKETKKLDNWFSEHFEIQFVGGNKKENKRIIDVYLKENLTKKPSSRRKSSKRK